MFNLPDDGNNQGASHEFTHDLARTIETIPRLFETITSSQETISQSRLNLAGFETHASVPSNLPPGGRRKWTQMMAKRANSLDGGTASSVVILSADEEAKLRLIFDMCDIYNEKQVSKYELIKACKRNRAIADFFHLPQGMHGAAEELFKNTNTESNHVMTWQELKRFFASMHDLRQNEAYFSVARPESVTSQASTVGTDYSLQNGMPKSLPPASGSFIAQPFDKPRRTGSFAAEPFDELDHVVMEAPHRTSPAASNGNGNGFQSSQSDPVLSTSNSFIADPSYHFDTLVARDGQTQSHPTTTNVTYRSQQPRQFAPIPSRTVECITPAIHNLDALKFHRPQSFDRPQSFPYNTGGVSQQRIEPLPAWSSLPKPAFESLGPFHKVPASSSSNCHPHDVRSQGMLMLPITGTGQMDGCYSSASATPAIFDRWAMPLPVSTDADGDVSMFETDALKYKGKSPPLSSVNRAGPSNVVWDSMTVPRAQLKQRRWPSRAAGSLEKDIGRFGVWPNPSEKIRHEKRVRSAHNLPNQKLNKEICCCREEEPPVSGPLGLCCVQQGKERYSLKM